MSLALCLEPWNFAVDQEPVEQVSESASSTALAEDAACLPETCVSDHLCLVTQVAVAPDKGDLVCGQTLSQLDESF